MEKEKFPRRGGFANTELYKQIEAESLNIPQPTSLYGRADIRAIFFFTREFYESISLYYYSQSSKERIL